MVSSIVLYYFTSLSILLDHYDLSTLYRYYFLVLECMGLTLNNIAMKVNQLLL